MRVERKRQCVAYLGVGRDSSWTFRANIPVKPLISQAFPSWVQCPLSEIFDPHAAKTRAAESSAPKENPYIALESAI